MNAYRGEAASAEEAQGVLATGRIHLIGDGPTRAVAGGVGEGGHVGGVINDQWPMTNDQGPRPETN